MANGNGQGRRGEQQPAPVIIKKRRRRQDHEQHGGGTWKIAYADFVTALLCVFLVLWLINVTTERQREGIADYFNPLASRQEAEEASSSFFSGTAPQEVEGQMRSGGRQMMAPPVTAPHAPGRRDVTGAETMDAEAVAERIRRALQEVPGLEELGDNVRVERTPRGLRIQIIDGQDFAMFAPGSAQLTERGRKLLTTVDKVVALLAQPIVVTGHTDARPYGGSRYADNWGLSAARANAAKRAMTADRIAGARFRKIQGKAARQPLLPESPTAAPNRRISILLLTGRQAAGRSARSRAETPKRWLDITGTN
jgi:chemotaxis protein MotB